MAIYLVGDEQELFSSSRTFLDMISTTYYVQGKKKRYIILPLQVLSAMQAIHLVPSLQAHPLVIYGQWFEYTTLHRN